MNKNLYRYLCRIDKRCFLRLAIPMVFIALVATALVAVSVDSKRVSDISDKDASETAVKDFWNLAAAGGVIIRCFLSKECETNLVRESEIALENLEDKPNNVHPEFTSVIFKGVYGDKRTDSFFSPRIRIYSVQKFRRALSVSPVMTRVFDRDVAALEQIITDKNSEAVSMLPFIPYIDGHPSFFSRVKFLSFENGEGIGYLTQFDIEPSIVNNEGLTFIFQGFTTNKKHYVLATFPVSFPPLPEDYTATSFENYRLPDIYNDPKYAESNGRAYKAYIQKVRDLLEMAKNEQFQPHLKEMERTLSSLNISSDLP